MTTLQLPLQPPAPLDLRTGTDIAVSWKRFKEAFENYEIATGLDKADDRRRVAVFLHVVGEAGVEKYNTLTWTSDDDKYKIKEVLNAFETDCKPRSNVIVERYKFLRRKQESNETCDQFVTQLRVLAQTCQYDSTEEMIRDQFILNLYDDVAREKLLDNVQMDTKPMTLERAVDFVKHYEMRVQQKKQMATGVVVNECRPNEEDVDKNVTCRVCLGLFDDGVHRPLLLPACGHTFCSFCIDNLHTKGILKCPVCRKDNAVKAISSLPVNYSLLSVVHFKVMNTSDVTKKQDEAATKPMSTDSLPEWFTRTSDPPLTCRADGPTVSLISSGPPKPLQSNPYRSSSNEKMRMTTVNRMDPHRGFNSLRRHKLCMGENSKETTSHERLTEEEKNMIALQEELDFQMAVHLTFCKDASHGHDDPVCASNCWQFPVDDDINTALSVSQTFKG